MHNALGKQHLSLLVDASHGALAARDEDEARDLDTLVRVGLLIRYEAGLHVLSEAGRRYLIIEAPFLPPPAASGHVSG